MRAFFSGASAVVAVWLLVPLAPASAQILIWSLPKEDGTWVRFEGDYKQTRARPNINAGDEILEWRSELTISAVGRESAEIDAKVDGQDVKKEVPCRWVEFKAITKPKGLEKQPGPADSYAYKVLIPEERVIGKPVDADNIPVTFLPIVKGWRKVGLRDAEPVTEKALAVYPTLALVTYYPNLKADGDQAEQLQVGDESVAVRLFKGTRVYQKKTNRSTNSGTLWRSDEVPFGLARFQVSVTLEEKEIAAPVDEFKRTSLIEVEMAVVATGDDARSELGDDKAADEKPDDDKPSDSKPADESSDDEKPADENAGRREAGRMRNPETKCPQMRSRADGKR